MALVNAVYFRDYWKHKFDPKLTVTADFHPTPTTTIKVQMMQQQEKFPYGGGKDCQIVELPYVGDRFSMLIVLPDSHEKLASVENSLQDLNQWIGALQESKVNLQLPRFSMESHAELAKDLFAMGMSLAFSQQADLTGIAPDLTIAAVHHSAKMIVDEEGTTGGAATVVDFALGGFERPAIHCDRPFLVVLREKSTGGILFLGRVMQPETSVK